jgi:hypothetical protein
MYSIVISDLRGNQKVSEHFMCGFRTFQPECRQPVFVPPKNRPWEQKRMAKRTTITLETTSLLIFRARTVRQAWCPECGAEAEMVATVITAVPLDPSQHAGEKWLDSMDLHRVQAPDGAVLICLHSLLALVQNTKTT